MNAKNNRLAWRLFFCSHFFETFVTILTHFPTKLIDRNRKGKGTKGDFDYGQQF